MILMDKKQIEGAILNITEQIIKKNANIRTVALIGIKTRGLPLAERISICIGEKTNVNPPVGGLDITLYRDDLTLISDQPLVKRTDIGFDMQGRDIIIVDDVLFTGRTIRCAMDAIMDFGRPNTIQLAVLVDRGLRELPIQANYVGKKIETKKSQIVQVRLEDTDGVDEVEFINT
jgi:pyrimidine operon attenuation protein/uracil phosphoribosyltransferase